ncbi:hypothetical protein Vretimale_12925 [Volvox reticuliferus]|nr:hypothetical protein Vretifemale_9242 [Volvox reticuliferus]GIM09031.1 hypothetical protein Vretimale_12925 [Volvox reticuliferus]
MWLSASAFFNQYFRVYSPISFGKKYDPDGKFIRKFLPVLKNMPSKYIYEPWTAPPEVQRRAGCIIGRDYPTPIVDHPVASKRNIARMAAAYRANKSAADTDGGGDGNDEYGPTSMAAAAAASKALRGKPSKKSATSTAAVTATGAAAAPNAANKATAGSGGGNGGGASDSAAAAASSAIAAATAFTARQSGTRSKTDVVDAEKAEAEDLALAAATAAFRAIGNSDADNDPGAAAADKPTAEAEATVKGTMKARSVGFRGGRGGNKRQRTIQEALKPMTSG